MEREQSRKRFNIRKRDMVLSTVLAASISAGIKSGSEARVPYQPQPYSGLAFRPVLIDELYQSENPSTMPYSNIEISDPSPLSLSEKDEFDSVIDKMSSYPGLFSGKKLEDIKIYYQIYRDAAEKYDIDWYLLFIVHEAETGASRGERGFAPESYYKGAIQRDPNIWPQSYVEESAEGLEYLSKLSQRHETDWKEIAAAAHILSDNFHKYKDQGDSKSNAVLKALLLYSAEGPARERFEKYKKYEEIFSEEIIREDIASKAS